MQIAQTIAETRAAVAAARQRGLSIALVPTMGALHEGHASLFSAARQDASFVVASIFVNPTQFGPHEDLSRYPRPFEHDLAVCNALHVDLVFHPEPETIYPPNYRTFVEVEGLQDVLCGASRPGHFRGVTTVVLKLFNIIQPDIAYFGQKDAQQFRILQQMVRDLNLPVRVEVGPTVREPDGLALSSRNQYLDADQRRHAAVLFRTLTEVSHRVEAGERRTARLLQAARDMIAATAGARLDYAAAVDFATLSPLDDVQGRVLFALAVFFGTTRLIDNIIVDVRGP